MSSCDSDSDCSEFDWEGFYDCVKSDMIKEVKEFLEDPRCNIDDDESDFTPLLVAIDNGNVEMVKVLIDAGYSVDQMSREGETPLSEAIECQDLDMIKVLVEEYNADIENGNGNPGVVIATSQGQLEIVQYFVEKGADKKNILYACFEAAKSKDTTILEYLFSIQGKRPSSNILIEASHHGSQPSLEFLLKQQDMDVNYENKKKMTALCAAVERGHLECVRTLLENNATITDTIVLKSFEQKNGDISAIIFETAKKNFVSSINDVETITNDEGNTILHLMFKQKINQDLSMQIIKRYKSVLNKQNNAGETPLIIACKHNVNTEIFTYLLNRSKPCYKDNKGNTAVMYAAKNGRLDMVSALFKKKVSVKRLKNVKGKILLHKCVKSQNFELVDFLDKQGILGDVNTKDVKLQTPLMLCKESISIASFLVSKGANLKDQDNEGNTIVHRIVKSITSKNADECIKLIDYIVKSCDEIKTIKNNTGKTPLHLAKKYFNSGKLYRILSG